MSQNIVDFSGNPTGAGLMDDYLDKELQNILTSNSGIQRPSYAVVGTKWIDMSATPWLLKMYDGTDDVVIGTIDPSTHEFIASNPLTTTGDLIVQNEDGKPERLASGTAGTVLRSNGIGKVPSWQKLSIEIKQDLTNPSADTVPSTKAVLDESSRLKSDINNKVNKSGDRMTGRIDFHNNYDLIWNTTPAAGNKERSMVLGNTIDSGGTTVTNLATRKVVNGKELYSLLQTFITPSGQIGTLCPGCNFDNAILTAVHNEPDAVRLGNGLILNWGEITVGDDQTVPVVLKIPYSGTNYRVVFGHNNQAAGGTDFYHPQIVYGTKTTTGFSIYNRNAGSYHLSNVAWFAIGR